MFCAKKNYHSKKPDEKHLRHELKVPSANLSLLPQQGQEEFLSFYFFEFFPSRVFAKDIFCWIQVEKNNSRHFQSWHLKHDIITRIEKKILIFLPSPTQTVHSIYSFFFFHSLSLVRLPLSDLFFIINLIQFHVSLTYFTLKC